MRGERLPESQATVRPGLHLQVRAFTCVGFQAVCPTRRTPKGPKAETTKSLGHTYYFRRTSGPKLRYALRNPVG